MAYVTDISYVAGFRQLSIPLGAGLGIVFLKEPCPAAKIAGIAVLFIGLVLIGVG